MSDPWFKLYPSDWLSGTRGLTPAETGVYVTLICIMYEQEGKIARNDARLARRCGCTAASFKKILKNLLFEEKIIDNDGFLTNERVQKELTERHERVQKSTDAAQKKWAAYRQKSQQNQKGEAAPAGFSEPLGNARIQSQNQTLNSNKNQRKAGSFETPLQRVSRSLNGRGFEQNSEDNGNG